MRKTIFPIFRRFVAKVSGYGLRKYFPLVDRLYKKINKSLAPASVSVHGHIMFLDEGDSLGLAVNGEYETVETKIIEEYISDGHVVLDIGANIGYFTLKFARLVGEHGRVYAFEPDPVSFEILTRNLSINGYSNVIMEPLAVSNTSTQAYLQRDKYNNLDHRIVKESSGMDTLSIRTIRLDDYFKGITGAIDFIKMDIQGAEILALDGMRDILMRSRDVKLLTEYWPIGLEHFGDENSSSHYLHEIEGLGFNIYEVDKITGAVLHRSPAEILNKYQPTTKDYTNLLCVRRGI